MRIRRQNSAQPIWDHGWTDDPVMGKVRFCNVRREDDKVTKWLAENWRLNHHKVWEIVLARFVNWIPTLHEIVGGDLDKVRHAMIVLRGRGKQIWGNAYTVSTNGLSLDKVDYVIDRVIRPIQEYGDPRWRDGSHTLQETFDWLVTRNGIGSFMAGQIIADLKNTQGHALQTAPDWHTWASPGPGSLRGLEAYFGRRVTPSGFTQALQTVANEVYEVLPDDFPNLHMQDLQNCMCEFSKYMRVKGGGHARNRYSAG